MEKLPSKNSWVIELLLKDNSSQIQIVLHVTSDVLTSFRPTKEYFLHFSNALKEALDNYVDNASEILKPVKLKRQFKRR